MAQTVYETIGSTVMRAVKTAAPVISRSIPDHNPFAPRALRIERTRSRSTVADADQTAVTMWFGEGPSLPSIVPASPFPLQTMMRIGAGVVGAVALAALTTRAARSPRTIHAARVMDDVCTRFLTR